MTNSNKIYLKDNPILMAEWDYSKNTDLSPLDLSWKSDKKAWWRCLECNYSWSAMIKDRSRGRGCPMCARKRGGENKRKNCALKNNFALKFPDLAAEWHPTKNSPLLVTEISVASNKKVWWLCSCCGNEWQTTVSHRTTQSNGCPVCSRLRGAEAKVKTHAQSNNFAVVRPDIAKEWHPTKNTFSAEDVSVFSNKKVWWICSFCGHEWENSVNHRSHGEGCPNCSRAQTSLPEQIIFYYVSKTYPDAINRYKYTYEFDIFIPSIRTAIEYDGAFFHKLKSNLIQDNKKDVFCKKEGIRLIRFRSPELKDTQSSIRITCDDHHLENGIKELFVLLGRSCPILNLEKDKLLIIQNFRETLVSKSLESNYPSISKQWHPTKNGKTTPSSVMPMSNIKFWWLCEKCGYEWMDTPNHRCGRDSGCPACVSKAVFTGVNDLATLHPMLTSEWNYEKNNGLLPSEVLSQSNKKVWWTCKEHGHEWQAAISERTRINRSTHCPYCSNKKVLPGFNDLSTLKPDIAKEWNFEKNSTTPNEVTAGSSKKVWWTCSICGNEWQAVIYSRKSCGCPICKRAQKTRK